VKGVWGFFVLVGSVYLWGVGFSFSCLEGTGLDVMIGEAAIVGSLTSIHAAGIVVVGVDIDESVVSTNAKKKSISTE